MTHRSVIRRRAN